jgi:hypothetical protein
MEPVSMAKVLSSKMMIILWGCISIILLSADCGNKSPADHNIGPTQYLFHTIPLSQNRLITQTSIGGFVLDGFDTLTGYLSICKVDSNGRIEWISMVEDAFRDFSVRLIKLYDSSIAILYAQEELARRFNFTVAIFSKNGSLSRKIQLAPFYARDMIQCLDGKIAVVGSLDPSIAKTSQIKFINIDGTLSSEISVNRGDLTSLGYIREEPDSTFLVTLNVYNHIVSSLDVDEIIHIDKQGTILNEHIIDSSSAGASSSYDLQYLSDSCLIA